LVAAQTPQGHVAGATTSITASSGQALVIETTALATLAWLRDPAYADATHAAARYLAECCQGGRYGSTQSTVLALRAIVAYDQANAHPQAPGSLQLLQDGVVVQAVPFDQETRNAIELVLDPQRLQPGRHQLSLTLTGGSPMQHAFELAFQRTLPPSADQSPLRLSVELTQPRVVEGEVLEALVTIRNTHMAPVPTPIAIIGLPGGAEPRHEQLKELVKAGTIAAYEVRGREIILYWRLLAAEAELTLPLSLIAAIPGNYSAPASRAYLYYGDEHKRWVAGAQLEIVPR
jgi:hypothetical protein